VKIEFKEKRTNITEEDIAARKALAEDALKEIENGEYTFSVTADKFKLSYENVTI
jgi:hypothetical protein